MKLATAALAVSLSLFGCASDNDGEGGGYLDGLRPAKPSIDDTKPVAPGINPAVAFVLNGGLTHPIKEGAVITTPDGGEVSAERINVPFPVEGLCIACEVVVLRDARDPNELNLIDDHGHFFCRLWVDSTTGQLMSTDCR